MYADAKVRSYIRSRCRDVARNAMIVGEFRPALPGKQSDENLDTSLLSNVPPGLPPQGSRQLFLEGFDVRFGSQAEVGRPP